MTIKDYQDWLKNNKKVKVPKDGEELSTYDELENKALYDQYVREAELFNQKKDAEAELQAQKETALRDHYVSQEKSQKQAQDALSMQGITSGISESGLIDLYAQGAAARAKIISANDSAKNDVLSDYRNKVAESKLETNKDIAEIDALRLAKREQDEEKQVQENEITKQNAVNQFANLLNSYGEEDSDIDFEEVRSAYETFSPYLDELDNYDIISTYKKYAKDADEAARRKTIPLSSDDYDVNINSAKFTSKAFGDFYETGEDGTKQEKLVEAYINDVKDGKVEIGQVCVFNYGVAKGAAVRAKNSNRGAYIYLGDGAFRQISDKELKTAWEQGKVYIPNGYKKYNDVQMTLWK